MADSAETANDIGSQPMDIEPSEANRPGFSVPEIGWQTLLPFVISAALLASIAFPVLSEWFWEYTKPDSYYTHAPIIPFICALMLWYKRREILAAAKVPDLRAVPLIILALGLLVFALKEELEAVRSTAFLLVVTASIWLALGPKFMKAAAFPIAFLWLMAPLPGPILNDATLRLQMFSTVFAAKILQLLAFQPVLAGNVINMENFSLFVDVPCSGFKLLLAYLTFSAAFAYLVDGPVNKRILLFLITIPLSLVVNAVRIALIGVVGDCISSDAAHEFHDWSGMITLILGFIVLFSLAKAFGCRKFAGWDIF